MCRLAATVSNTSMASPPAERTFSWMAMVSAPSGTGAPVKMRTASPAPTLPGYSFPAAAMPVTVSRAGTWRDIGGAHRIAVHRRSRERRLRPKRLQRPGKHPARGLRQRHGLRA